MSERELLRIEVLTQAAEGALAVSDAAEIMDVTRRHAHRLLARFRAEGAGGLAHKARVRPPNNRRPSSQRAHILALVREKYPDFGPTLAAEMLAARDGVTVSREALRAWMTEAGLWVPRKQRRTLHQPRRRRECVGELVQIDGSEHRWFEERGDPCTLLVFVDDATSALKTLLFTDSESTGSYFEALEAYLTAHGRPVAFYSDKHSVFRVTRGADNANGDGITQFGRALAELNVDILCANSSQAKGRVERANRTLQDRLVKELRLAGVNDIEAANAFVPDFIARYNAKFAKAPLKETDLHRPSGGVGRPPARHSLLARKALCRTAAYGEL